MLTNDIRTLIHKDFPCLGPVTKEVRDQMKRDAARYRGSVRLATGRVWTNEEYAERRNRVLSTPLP